MCLIPTAVLGNSLAGFKLVHKSISLVTQWSEVAVPRKGEKMFSDDQIYAFTKVSLQERKVKTTEPRFSQGVVVKL